MSEAKKRLTYLMLFRVGVVTLLLVATFLSELAAPADQPVSPRTDALLALIAATYGFTIVFALWLERGTANGARTRRLAAAQVAIDLLLSTALVHLTGGAESGFAFLYLMVIVWSSFVLEASAIGTAAAAVVLYAAAIALERAGLLPLFGQAQSHASLSEVLRATGINAVAFAATGVLAARLSVELKRAGESLAFEGRRLRDLTTLHEDVIRSLTSGLVTLGPGREVVTCNAAAAEILGLDAAQVIDRPVTAVVPSLAPLLDAVTDASPLRRGEMTHLRAGGGERILGVSISPLVDSRGAVSGRIVSFQDLTELRRMEEAMARSERLAAIGRLAAGVAHEIRNPLQAISGSIELLAQSPAESGELMAIVLREVERLNGLITDLLAFARPRPPEPVRLDLAVALGETLRVLQNDKQQGTSPIELIAPAPVFTLADPGQLRQVVWNLVRNAAQASPAGAAITIEVGTDDGGAKGEPRWARFSVRDRGPGIPAEHRARMFEPFFSTKEGGTGLGLATVHRIVEDHRGRVEIEAPEGGGTQVTVRLPIEPLP